MLGFLTYKAGCKVEPPFFLFLRAKSAILEINESKDRVGVCEESSWTSQSALCPSLQPTLLAVVLEVCFKEGQHWPIGLWTGNFGYLSFILVSWDRRILFEIAFHNCPAFSALVRFVYDMTSAFCSDALAKPGFVVKRKQWAGPVGRVGFHTSLVQSLRAARLGWIEWGRLMTLEPFSYLDAPLIVGAGLGGSVGL